jgi:Holliday junction resolvase-like predicted endonuclease
LITASDFEHNRVVEQLAAQFEKKGYKAQTRNNNLPTEAGRGDAIYRPDIIVRKSDGEIVWLVEVETSEAGKAVAGAAILADICMQKMNVRDRPKPLFVFYRPSANLILS